MCERTLTDGQAAITNQKTIYEQEELTRSDGFRYYPPIGTLRGDEVIASVVDLFGGFAEYGEALFLNKEESVITDSNGFVMQVA